MWPEGVPESERERERDSQFLDSLSLDSDIFLHQSVELELRDRGEMAADREFLQFSDQIRLQTAGMSSLSLGDSIWSDSFLAPKPYDARRNAGSSPAAPPAPPAAGIDAKLSPWGSGQKLAFNDGKMNRFNNLNTNGGGAAAAGKGPIPFNGGFNSYLNSSNYKSSYKGVNQAILGHGVSKKKNNIGNGVGNHAKKNESNDGAAVVDKRFKTLPPSESLPRSEAIGGYIFVCNNDTMLENLQRQLFGLPQRYRDSVRAITPGLPIFLYNYSTHQLHGIFEAASFGGTNIDPVAWEDKKKPGESRFPAQVKVMTRKIYEPLEEDSFRPILHHYDGPKFRLELSVPEALELLDKFEDNDL